MECQYNAFLLRYHEIAIKGKNRRMFENKLVDSVHRLLKGIENLRVKNQRGRIIVHLKEWADFKEEELELAIAQLRKCFGLESFSPVICVETDMAVIEQTAMAAFDTAYANYTARFNGEVRYRMRARRSLKSFPLNSKELEIHFANMFLPKYDKLKVDLENAALTIGLEVREKHSFVWFDSYEGPGGLPIGSSGSVMALLSGGIDSPVACYTAMKRGSQCSFITFHSHPYTPPTAISKVAQIAGVINSFQRKQPLLACNLASAQKAIRDNCSERFRTILYRRMMMRVASVVSDWHNDKALLTGESLGQVASQTLENMTVINASTTKLILRPLVCYDKNEAVRLARKMGTMELSSIDVPDSCTIFAPGSPATKAKLPFVLQEEAKLDVPKLVRESLQETTQVDLESYELTADESLQIYVESLSDDQLYC